MAYTRKISLVHAGLDVMFFLQWLHLHTVIQGTGTNGSFTSAFSFDSWTRITWTGTRNGRLVQIHWRKRSCVSSIVPSKMNAATFVSDLGHLGRKVLLAFSQNILPKHYASSAMQTLWGNASLASRQSTNIKKKPKNCATKVFFYTTVHWKMGRKSRNLNFT